MKLETEFRIRLQLHQLLKVVNSGVTSDRTQFCHTPLTSRWVTLVQAAATCWSNEALLLCQTSEHEWIAWVPELGEITLNSNSFYL
jgi:hypothetical protein